MSYDDWPGEPGERLRTTYVRLGRILCPNGRSWLSIVQKAALENGAQIANILRKSKLRGPVLAKAQAWWELREAGYAFTTIGAEFGVSHSTVQSAVERHARRVAERSAA